MAMSKIVMMQVLVVFFDYCRTRAEEIKYWRKNTYVFRYGGDRL
jgi:hypothetical protein